MHILLHWLLLFLGNRSRFQRHQTNYLHWRGKKELGWLTRLYFSIIGCFTGLFTLLFIKYIISSSRWLSTSTSVPEMDTASQISVLDELNLCPWRNAWVTRPFLHLTHQRMCCRNVSQSKSSGKKKKINQDLKVISWFCTICKAFAMADWNTMTSTWGERRRWQN